MRLPAVTPSILATRATTAFAPAPRPRPCSDASLNHLLRKSFAIRMSSSSLLSKGRKRVLVGGADKPPAAAPAMITTKVQPGIICRVDGLKSETGKKLNGKRCIIIRYVEKEGRYVGIYSIPWVGNNIISLIILLISISSLKCIPKNNNNNSHNLKLRRPTTTLLKCILLDSTNYISDFAVA